MCEVFFHHSSYSDSSFWYSVSDTARSISPPWLSCIKRCVKAVMRSISFEIGDMRSLRQNDFVCQKLLAGFVQAGVFLCNGYNALSALCCVSYCFSFVCRRMTGSLLLYLVVMG